MVKGEGLEILEQRMQSLDPSGNDTYRFLGVEQADGIQRIRFFRGLKSKCKIELRRSYFNLSCMTGI